MNNNHKLGFTIFSWIIYIGVLGIACYMIYLVVNVSQAFDNNIAKMQSFSDRIGRYWLFAKYINASLYKEWISSIIAMSIFGVFGTLSCIAITIMNDRYFKGGWLVRIVLLIFLCIVAAFVIIMFIIIMTDAFYSKNYEFLLSRQTRKDHAELIEQLKDLIGKK
ncbi:hypothetical protein [Mycoplasmopsis adleri]|uniref:hypothetical protein n=1 Tax=Mycoplasmopsis adleri TaxID=51362 RepID=UPI0038730694